MHPNRPRFLGGHVHDSNVLSNACSAQGLLDPRARVAMEQLQGNVREG